MLAFDGDVKKKKDPRRGIISLIYTTKGKGIGKEREGKGERERERKRENSAKVDTRKGAVAS